jgi:phosphatidylglycerol lysyltransferase
MEGSFDPANLGHRRLFVARSEGGAGRVESLLVCNPGESGAFWAFELYRYRRDAVRGAVPFLMHQVMQQLKREGAQRVSLCLIPGQNCDQPLEGDSRLTRWALMIGSRYFNFIFDTTGTAYFKSRFRPRYEPRYIAAWPRQTLSSAWAFVRATGVLELDYGKTLRLAAGGAARACRKLLSPASAKDS